MTGRGEAEEEGVGPEADPDRVSRDSDQTQILLYRSGTTAKEDRPQNPGSTQHCSSRSSVFFLDPKKTLGCVLCSGHFPSGEQPVEPGLRDTDAEGEPEGEGGETEDHQGQDRPGTNTTVTAWICKGSTDLSFTLVKS